MRDIRVHRMDSGRRRGKLLVACGCVVFIPGIITPVANAALRFMKLRGFLPLSDTTQGQEFTNMNFDALLARPRFDMLLFINGVLQPCLI